MPSTRWSRIAATGKVFRTRKRLRACSAAVEPSLTPASCKHSFPSPSRKPPTFLRLQERVCRQRSRRRFIIPPASRAGRYVSVFLQPVREPSQMCGEVFYLAEKVASEGASEIFAVFTPFLDVYY